jgi:uncharacterized protein
MQTLEIIRKYYGPESGLYKLLVGHSEAVARKALSVAEKVRHLGPDFKFIEEAAMLHDIGIFLTDSPELGCTGSKPYVCHGYLGRELLENEGLPKHALVCERHVGVGITKEEIVARGLPLPVRDMVPISLEEQIICFADKFFSKDRDVLVEKTVDEVREHMARFGASKVERLDEWLRLFGV